MAAQLAVLVSDPGFVQIFALPFMWRALVTVAVLAVAAGVVGLFISFRELEFVSDGLVHAVFPGLVVGAAIGGTSALLPGAAVAAVLAAVLFTVIERRGGVGADAAIAVVLTGLFSLGIVLVSRQEGYVSQLQDLLFGRLLTVTSAQLVQVVIVAALAVLIVLASWRVQLYRAFDSAGAEAAGYRPFTADIVLGIAVALLVVAGVQALGVLMVIALLTVPMAAARLLTRGFALLIPLAVLLPLAAGVGGLWLSFEWSIGTGASVSPGAVVVLLLIAGYLLAAFVRVVVLRAPELRCSPVVRSRTAISLRNSGESRNSGEGSPAAADCATTAGSAREGRA